MVNHSIAGVKLGQSVGAAKSVWHARCHPQGDAEGCLWGSAGKGGHLGFVYARGLDTVFQISIVATSKDGHSVFRKPLTTVKTAKGIGLGSKVSAARRAYPGGSSTGYRYTVKRGKISTTFDLTEGHRISAITIERVHLARP